MATSISILMLVMVASFMMPTSESFGLGGSFSFNFKLDFFSKLIQKQEVKKQETKKIQMSQSSSIGAQFGGGQFGQCPCQCPGMGSPPFGGPGGPGGPSGIGGIGGPPGGAGVSMGASSMSESKSTSVQAQASIQAGASMSAGGPPGPSGVGVIAGPPGGAGASMDPSASASLSASSSQQASMSQSQSMSQQQQMSQSQQQMSQQQLSQQQMSQQSSQSMSQSSSMSMSQSSSSRMSIASQIGDPMDILSKGITAGLSFKPIISSPFGTSAFGTLAFGTPSLNSLMQQTSCSAALQAKSQRLQSLTMTSSTNVSMSSSVSVSQSSSSVQQSSSQSVQQQSSKSFSLVRQAPPTVFHSQVDTSSFKSTFTSVFTQETKTMDLKNLYFALSGAHVLGQKDIPNQDKLCTTIKTSVQSITSEQSSESKSMNIQGPGFQASCQQTKYKNLYRATGSASQLTSCDLQMPQPVVADLHKTAQAPSDLFYALATQQNLGLELNSKEIFQTLIQKAQMYTDPQSIGYICHAACLMKKADFTDDLQKQFADLLRNLLMSAQDVGDSLLQFAGGVQTTSLVVSGMYSLIERIDKKHTSFFSSDYSIKFSNYLLSQKRTITSDIEGSYYFLGAMNKLSSNQMHVPAVVSLMTPQIQAGQKKIQVRVSDPMGRPLPAGAKVQLSTMTNQKWKRFSCQKTELTVSKTDQSVYELDVSKFSRSHGLHNLQFNIDHQDKRVCGNMGASVAVNIKKEMKVEEVSIFQSTETSSSTSISSSSSKSVSMKEEKKHHGAGWYKKQERQQQQQQKDAGMKIQFGKKCEKQIHHESSKQFQMKFQMKDEMYSKVTKSSQTFIVMQHAETKQEYYYAVKADKTNTFDLQLDMQKAAEKFGGKGGLCHMKMMVGGDATANAFSWHMADMQLNVSSSSSSSSTSVQQQQQGGGVIGLIKGPGGPMGGPGGPMGPQGGMGASSQQSLTQQSSQSSSVSSSSSSQQVSFSSMNQQASSLSFSTQEVTSFKQVLTQKIESSSDVSSIYYSMGALNAIDSKQSMSSFQSVTSKIEKSVQVSNVESLFKASGACQKLNYKMSKLDMTKVSQTLNQTFTSATSTKSLYHACATNQYLGTKMIDSSMSKTVSTTIIQKLKSDSTALSLGYAFQAAAYLPDPDPSIFDHVQRALSQAVIVNKQFLHFENSVSVTANLMSGIFMLAEKLNKPPPITPEQFSMVSNYLLSQRTVVQDEKTAYHLSKCLKIMSENKFHSAVVVSSASTETHQEISSKNTKVQVRVSNAFGQSVKGISKVYVQSSSHTSSSSVNVQQSELKLVSSDSSSSLYEMDFMQEKRACGEHKLSVNFESSDKRHIAVSKEISVKVASEVSIKKVEMQIHDSKTSQMQTISLNYPKPHDQTLHIEDSTKSMNLNFALSEEVKTKISTVQKAFVVVQHSETKEEHIFNVELDSNNQCKGSITMQEATSSFKSVDFKKSSHLCHMKLVVGDASVGTPFSYPMADMNVKFQAPEKNAQCTCKDPTVKDLRKSLAYSYFSQSDMELIKTSLHVSVQNTTDISTICYAVAGMTVLNKKLESTTEITSVITQRISSFSSQTKLEEFFFVSSAAATLNQQISVSEEVTKVLTSTISDESITSEQLYYAVSSLKNMKKTFEQTTLVKSITSIFKKETTAIRMAYAFSSAMHLESFESSTKTLMIQKMKETVSMAQEIDSTYLSYDSVETTAFVLTSLFSLSEKMSLSIEEFPLTETQIIKMAKYLLSNKDVLESRVSYRLSRALKVLTDNKYFVPVCVSLVQNTANAPALDPTTPPTGAGAGLVGAYTRGSGLALNSITITAASSKVQFSVTNMMSEQISQEMTLEVDSASHIESSSIDSTNVEMKKISATTYEVDFQQYIQSYGRHEVQLSMKSSEKKLLILEKKFYINSLVQVSIDKLELSVSSSSSSSSSSQPIILSYPKPNPTAIEISQSNQQTFSLKFQVQQKSIKKVVKVRQVFVSVQCKETKKETIYVLKGDESNTYSYTFNLKKIAKDFEYKSGTFSVRLIGGDSSVYNPFVWRLTDVNFKFSKEEINSTTVSNSTELRLVGASKFLYITEQDKQSIKSVFVQQLQKPTDLEALMYSASGMALLGFKDELKQYSSQVTSYLQQQRTTAITKVSSMFFFHGVSFIMDIKSVSIKASEAQTVVDTLFKQESIEAKELYLAVSLQQGIKEIKLDQTKVKKFLTDNSGESASGLSMGFGFHTAAVMFSQTKELLLVDKIDDVLDRAVPALQMKELQMEEGVNAMAIVFSGILALAEHADKVEALTQDVFIGFTRYLLTYQGLLEPSIAYNLMLALNKISNNKYFKPVSASLASASIDSEDITVSSINQNVELKVVNVMGQSVNFSSSYKIESSTFQSSSSIDTESIELKAGSDKTIQTCSFFDEKREKGAYTLNLNMQSSEKTAVLLKKEVNLNVGAAAAIDSLEMAVMDAEQQLVGDKLTLKYPDPAGSALNAALGQMIALKFQISEQKVQELISVNQVYAIVSHSTEVDKEMIFAATADSDNSYTLQMDVQRCKDMQFSSGTYDVKLAVGDASISNPFMWKLGSVALKL